MNKRSVDEIDLLKLIYQFWMNKVTIILVTVICALCGYLYSSYMIKPTYTATAYMSVNNKNDQQQSSSVTQSDLNASNSLVNTYSVILKSHVLLEEVIDDLDLPMTYNNLKSKVSVSAVNNTQVMSITISDTDPQRALNICTEIVDRAPDAIIQSIEAGSVTTVDPPWTTGKPVAPNIRRNALIAGLLGFLACLAVIVIKELTNDKFKTADDVKNTFDLPILGIIPVEEGQSKKKKSRKKRKSAGRRKE